MMDIRHVLNYCPHYDDIITYDFDEDDIYSLDFIEYYQNYIYSISELNENTIYVLKSLDFVLNRYISDNKFQKAFREKVSELSLANIIEFYNEYEDKEITNIDNTVWI